MSKKIITDLQIDTLAGSGTRPVVVNEDGKLEVGSSDTIPGLPTLLATYTPTAVTNVDIDAQASWDTYDRLEFVVQGLTNNSAGQIAWVMSSDSGATWMQFVNSTGEGRAWTDTVIPSSVAFNANSIMNLGSNQKAMDCSSMASIDSSTVKLNIPNNSTQGLVAQYNGSSLTSIVSAEHIGAWYTTGAGLDGYRLRLAHDGGGTFTAGTIKVLGYNYP